LPQEVHGKRVAELMGVEAWRDVSGDCIDDDTHKMLAALGWRYVPRRTGSVFQRLARRDADLKVSKEPSGSGECPGQLRAARGSLLSLIRSRQLPKKAEERSTLRASRYRLLSLIRSRQLPKNAGERSTLRASRYRLLSLIRSRIVHFPDDAEQRREAQDQLLALYRAGYDLPQGWDF
jgi:hypothetical protein